MSANTWSIEVKKDKGTNCILSWKPKWLYASKLKPLCTALLYSIMLSGYRMGMEFDRDPVEQNKYAIKIVNDYIAYDLDA